MYLNLKVVVAGLLVLWQLFFEEKKFRIGQIHQQPKSDVEQFPKKCKNKQDVQCPCSLNNTTWISVVKKQMFNL